MDDRIKEKIKDNLLIESYQDEIFFADSIYVTGVENNNLNRSRVRLANPAFLTNKGFFSEKEKSDLLKKIFSTEVASYSDLFERLVLLSQNHYDNKNFKETASDLISEIPVGYKLSREGADKLFSELSNAAMDKFYWDFDSYHKRYFSLVQNLADKLRVSGQESSDNQRRVNNMYLGFIDKTIEWANEDCTYGTNLLGWLDHSLELDKEHNLGKTADIIHAYFTAVKRFAQNEDYITKYELDGFSYREDYLDEVNSKINLLPRKLQRTYFVSLGDEYSNLFKEDSRGSDIKEGIFEKARSAYLSAGLSESNKRLRDLSKLMN